MKSLSSEDDLLRIELGDWQHPDTGKRGQWESRVGGAQELDGTEVGRPRSGCSFFQL